MNVKHLVSSKFPSVFELARDAYRAVLIRRHKAMTPSQIEAELGRLYKTRVAADLNLSNPQRYTEKIQWSKLYDHDPMRSLLSDKYACREWVAERIGCQYLIPLLGVWDHADEIDFEKLPDRFVIKTNNASGTNAFVEDKASTDLVRLRRKLSKWMAFEDAWYLFDMQYDAIEPKIIAEQYMVDGDGSRELKDYKFMCFNGEPRFVWVDVDRYSDHRRAVFDMEWKRQPWVQYDYPKLEEELPRPACFDEMISIARTLSQGFGHVRVDLYSINERPYFGEMTFTNGSGFERIIPDTYDRVIGDYWDLPLQKASGLVEKSCPSKGLTRMDGKI